MFLCQHDYGQLRAGAQREIADVHEVDIAPELAAIGRDGYMAAARVGRGPKATLRLCGELERASALAGAHNRIAGPVWRASAATTTSNGDRSGQVEIRSST